LPALSNSSPVKAVKRALAELAALGAARQHDDLVAVKVNGPGATQTFELRWAGRGWPGQVREAIQEIETPWPRQRVITAERFSPGAIELLRERDANWADLAGQARIVAPGIVVFKDQPQRRQREGEAPRFSWSPAAIAVAETLLDARIKELPRPNVIAEKLGWTVPRIRQVLQSFDREGWTEKIGPSRGSRAGRVLSDYEGLLESWSTLLAEERPPAVVSHLLMRDPLGFLRGELAEAISVAPAWAVSGWAAAELRAPLVTVVPTVQVYVPVDGLDEVAPMVLSAVGATEVAEGGRLELWGGDRAVFACAGSTDGLPIVSAPRLYADLLSFGGRGKDAADHVRGELLGV
jgi:hypothetical protein